MDCFFFWMHGTGQTAGPSVSTSYTVNYLDEDGVRALVEYWDRNVFTTGVEKFIPENGRGMMYMDSLELTTFGKAGQLWGYNVLKEFSRRRGYDLTPYLPFLVKEDRGGNDWYRYESSDQDWVVRLRNDFYQNITELYMENMLKPLQDWLHTKRMSLRAEISYGLPFEISLPGKYVDGIETESLEFCSQIDSYRNLAGPAHIYDRIYSSETGASLLNYKMGLGFYTQIIYTQFAAGISKTVMHGYSSIAGAERSTYWPGHEGMWPIFGERFGPRQPAFIHYKDWTGMIARYQYFIRRGKPRVDIGILRLDYRFNNLLSMEAGNNEEYVYGYTLMRDGKGIYWKDMQLQYHGYTWDYFAPQILEEDFVDYKNGMLLPDGPGYKALVIYQEELPYESARKIYELAKKGLPIIFVNGVTETVRPGNVCVTHQKAASKTPFNDKRDDELQALVKEMKELPNVREIGEQSQTWKTLQEMSVLPYVGYERENDHFLTHVQEEEGRRYLFIYNMQYTQNKSFAACLNIEGCGRLYRVNCWSGETEELGCYRVENGHTFLDMCLEPGSAAMLILDMSAEVPMHVESMNCEKARATIQNGILRVDSFCGDETINITLSDGRQVCFSGQKIRIVSPDIWYLEVEDWNEGEKKIILEDRDRGYATKEVYYETDKKRIQVGKTELKPWKEISGLGPWVSGIGRYFGRFLLPEDWGKNRGLMVKLENTFMHTAAVYINGKKAEGFDMDALTGDISALVHPGENEIMIEVSTSLNNRLQTRKYFENGEKLTSYYSKMAANMWTDGSDTEYDWKDVEMKEYRKEDIDWDHIDVRDYGLTGKVTFLPYTTGSI